MKNSLGLLCMLCMLSACKTDNATSNSYESEHLKIEKISENLYTHISYLDTENFGKVACNGLLYFNENEAIIFDTPTNNKASKALIEWVGNKNIKAVIATHFHIDCLGGLQPFHDKGIQSYATSLTIELAKENNEVLPQIAFDKKLEVQVGNETVLTQHFGQGHTQDNSVGYIASKKALFGGCLIKSQGAGKGNLDDANISEWPKTVAKIVNEFPEVAIVIPGHGKSGKKDLLNYTIKLFTEKQ